MKGDVQLMSSQYFLRQSSRIYGTRYADAACMLVDLQNRVGTRESKEEILDELDMMLSAQSDEALARDTFDRLDQDYADEDGTIVDNEDDMDEYRHINTSTQNAEDM